MNTANKLTLLRILLIPVFIFFALAGFIPFNSIIAVAVFAAASITDMLDGHIARSRELITDFGKFIDPLADKMLVSAAFITFVEQGYFSAVAVIVIIMREFIVTSLRLIASGSGQIIPAGSWGKIKTTVQMTAIILILLINENFLTDIIGSGYIYIINEVVQWIVVAATAISGIRYLWDNRKLIDTKK